MTEQTGSKTKAIVEAARRRAEIEKEVVADKTSDARAAKNLSDEEVSMLKEGAQEMADIKVQPRNGTIDGTIDIEAMGDVKGDGRDAKDYDDGDPDKALGVPVYEHGLHETSIDASSPMEALNRTQFGSRQSARTQAELDRGREALSSAKVSRDTARRGRTVVTDANDDPDGEDGRAKAEREAEAAKAKREAEAAEAKAKREAAAKK